jgi:hypothetical protein
MLARRFLGAALLLAATIMPTVRTAAQEVDTQWYECVTTTRTTTKTWTEDGVVMSVSVSVTTRVCTPISI